MRDAGYFTEISPAAGSTLAGFAIGSGAANGTDLARFVAPQKLHIFEVGIVQDSATDIGSAVVISWFQEKGTQVGVGAAGGTAVGTTSGTTATTSFRGKALTTKVSFDLEKGDALVMRLTTKSANASVTAYGIVQGYPHGQGATESNEQSVLV